jgi:hypothetical protein
MTSRSLILVVALATTGCLEVDPPNVPPTASIEVLLGGAALAPLAMTPTGVTAPAYMIMGAGQTVTLQGTGNDPDGRIASYEWWRTDVSRAMRNGSMGASGTGAAGAAGMAAGGAGGMGAAGTGAAGAGGMAAIPPPPFTGDPPSMASVSVELPVVGNYRYSLWVTDDGGLASVPATVTLIVR